MTNKLPIFIALVAFWLGMASTPLQAQVANDMCQTAEPLPELFPNIQECISGTTNGAVGELPYLNQGYCNGGAIAPNPSSDVWYSFTAVGNRLYIDFTSDLAGAVLSFYEGDCANLIGRDCVASEAGGDISYEFSPVDPGTTYYIQISGNSTVDVGDFNLCLINEEVTENICINNQSIYLDPLPDFGTYGPGQTVSICVNVEGYNENASDWLHGFVPVFGDGWDLTTLVTYPPASCDGAGEWAWYESVQGTSGVAIPEPQGPGFFYDSGAGGPFDGDPGNNFGDNSGESSCNWLFCFDVTTVSDAPAGTDYLDLSIEFLNFSDSETGSWNASASPCPNDPNLLFKALLQFCDAPILEATNPTCANPNGGSITATGIGTAPFTFVWSNGTTETGDFSTISGLEEGFYSVFSTDADGCTQGSSVTLTEESEGLNINIPVSVGGCTGCEASPSNPVAINILTASGSVYATQAISACPSLISICLPNDQTFGLQYADQIIAEAVVNGALTDDLFTFITGTPSDPGTMPTDQQTLCAGDAATANATGVALQDGHVLAYILHTANSTSAGTILAINTENGTFSASSGPGIQYNTVYYISSVAGPESGTVGVPDLGNACTQVAAGSPVVFLSPVELIINTVCDWQVTGDLTVTVFASGGLPAYDGVSGYTLSGTNLGETNINPSVTIINEGQGEHSYAYLATDALGCSGAAGNTFVCYKTDIELLSFAGKAEPHGNVLTWTTATETDNDYFTIERATDGVSFAEVGRVKGAGTVLSQQNYTLTDQNAPNGTAYYRLSQTDYNGTTRQAATTLVVRDIQRDLSVISLSPIPTTDVVQVQYALPTAQNLRLTLYNSAGQLVWSQTLAGNAGLNTTTVDLATYPSGVYALMLHNGTNSTVNRVVKK